MRYLPLTRVLPLLFGLAFSAQAQTPRITNVQNNYSFINPGSPNYGIAQGSLILISGTNLVATSNLDESFPLRQSLNGVSIAVTVNGSTTNPYLYYVYAAAGSQSYIAAVLPSSTPVGNGTITVTNNGSVSNAAPIQVVQTAVGLDTLFGAGVGRAVAQDASGALLSDSNAANPNQTIILWGSGVGPDPANSNEGALPQTQDNLTNLPLEVDIGGISATIAYRGRSQYPGIDQINVVVPPDVQAGCYVSVVAWAGSSISNFATIPIAASGKSCTDAVGGYTITSFQSVDSSRSQAMTVSYQLASLAGSGSGPFNVGDIVLELDNAPGLNLFGIPFPSAEAATTANMFQYSAAQLNATLNPYLISAGSCTVTPTQPDPGFERLNAGSEVDVSGPTGSGRALLGIGSYTSSQFISFLTSGTFTFSGLGGADVGPFNASTQFVSPPFVWNEMSISNAARSSPLKVSWSGGTPGSLVLISGMSGAGADQGGTKFFLCLAPVEAQQFTVPVTVLMSLPPTSNLDGLSSAYVAVSDSTPPQAFSADGLQLGLISSVVFNNTGILSDNFFWY